MAQMPALANATDINPLGGGLTNMNYRVDTPGKIYVMRVSDTITSLLGINRNNEMVNTERAHRAGVGAAVIDSLPHENVLLISWIDATTLHAADIKNQPEVIPRIAAALRTLHAGPSFQGNFYFPDIRRRYLRTVLDSGYFLPDNYLEKEQMILALEEKIARTQEIFVPCNNDLLPENFMDDSNKIWIIDYEYAGQNEASFELGNLASEIFFSDDELQNLCDAYWQQHLPSKIARAKAWSIIARFGWVMWASIQEGVSKIDFDFRSWGMKKWTSVLPEIGGKRYDEILRLL